MRARFPQSRDDREQKRSWLYGTLVFLCLVFFGIGFFPQLSGSFLYAVLVILMLAGLYLGFAEVFLLGLSFGLILWLRGIGALSALWPLPTALALGTVLVVGKLFPFTRGTFGWLKRGELGRTQVAAIVVISAVSAIALVAWYTIVNPDFSDISGRITRMHPVALVFAGLLFSAGNAICEEFVWRGMIYEALERASFPVTAVILLQALSFGFSHINGFPRGVSGIVLASIYGCLIGAVRHNSKGLLAPTIAHAFADAVIYSILVSVAQGTGT